MSIRLKLLAAVLITFTILFVALAGVSYAVIGRSFDDLEQQTVIDNLERVANTLADNSKTLAATVVDWAHWSDTYAYAQGDYDAFVEDNFYEDNSTMINLGVNMVVITDREGHIIWTKTVDLNTSESLPLPSGFETAYGETLRALPIGDDPEGGFQGLLRLPDRLLLIASRAILTSTRQGPAAGTLVFGVFVDATTEAVLS